jgi:nitronate monooxygenase
VLKSAVTCGARGDSHGTEKLVIGEEEGRPIYLFSTDSPLRSMTGDFESMALYAGTGVGRIDGIRPAGERLAAILAAAEALLDSGPGFEEDIESSSPVCYAGEFSGAYMGLLSEEELASDLWQLAGRMLSALRAMLAQDGDPDAPSRPPFAGQAAELAGWVLQMRQLALRAGKDAGQLRPPPPSPDHVPLLQGVSALVPKVAAADIRVRLAGLRGFLEDGRAQG